jgi:hypothetical protein
MKVYKTDIKTIADEYSLLCTGIFPASKEEFESWKKIKKNEVFEIEIKDVIRNYEHHKKFFAILNYCKDNSDFVGSVDDFLTACKYEIGFVHEIKELSGTVRIIPKSINFQSIGQRGFQEFYNRILFCLSQYMKQSIEEIEKNSVIYANNN